MSRSRSGLTIGRNALLRGAKGSLVAWAIRVRYWWERPSSRRNELDALRLRFLAEDGPDEVSEVERVSARRLREMRRELVEAFGDVKACASCGVGQPQPFGNWHGGACCGTETHRVYSALEIASLRAAGTSAWHLRPPHTPQHAGCVFRGSTGCSLPPEHRPNICVRYMCRDLETELRARGDLSVIKQMSARMRSTFAEFAEARAERMGKIAWRQTQQALRDLDRTGLDGH